MRRLLGILLLAFLFGAAFSSPTTAQSPSLLSEVATGDPDLGKALAGSRVGTVGYTDANTNGRLDAADPDEPVYLDLDGSKTVTYGDVRLSPFLRYGTGTAVDLTNRDVGNGLATTAGWFAREGATWYIDMDGNAKVTTGDLRFGTGVEKVGASDPASGRLLESSLSSKGFFSYVDQDRDGSRDLLEAIIVDNDPQTGGSNKVSVGDLRIAANAAGIDDDASQADVRAAVAALGPTPIVTSDGQTTTPPPAVAEQQTTAPSTWRTLDWILVVVSVANLAGLVVVGRVAAARHPKNPGQ